MEQGQLESVAQAMVAEGKGILAADESGHTIQSRFERINVISTEQTRRMYRELLFTAPGVEAFLSGVILYDETLRQSTADGTPFPELLAGRGILPGIKVDQGLSDLAGFPDEKITGGLDGLRDRLTEYRGLGARFAKWRAVITIGDGIPSEACIEANAHALARYAALCQEAALVPIVEPEVLMDGDHDIETCEEVTERTLDRVFSALLAHRVRLEGTVLKPSMVLSGKGCRVQASPNQVAQATLRCFRRTVPAAVPGVAFLSGGQSPERATEHLNAMNAMGPHPWEMSFSYGRALQEPVLNAWQGETANVPAAQKALYHRAKCNGLARSGEYSRKLEVGA